MVFQQKTTQIISVKTKGVELARLKLDAWVGQKFTDFVELDSTNKFASVLKATIDLENCELSDLEGDWKHINFFSPTKAPTPLLVKIFKFPGQNDLILAARDLGSMAKMQQKLMDTHRSMERDYLRLRHLESRYNKIGRASCRERV